MLRRGKLSDVIILQAKSRGYLRQFAALEAKS